MPSGHGSSGGHFGGGQFSGGSFSHGGGQFGTNHTIRSSRSSSSSSGSRPIYRPWYSPRVVVFGGRQVYLGTGRASAVSILGVLIIIAIIATVVMGIGWAACKDDYNEYADKVKTIEADYKTYHEMANFAFSNPSWQGQGKVTSSDEFEHSGKYCIYYTFEAGNGEIVGDGYSFYVYDYATVLELKKNGVQLALECPYEKSNGRTDSVPLNYKDTTLQDDAEYLAYVELRDDAYLEYRELSKVLRIGTFVGIGVIVALVVADVMVKASANKATAEQVAANSQSVNNVSSGAQNQNTATGTWRCVYCGTLNDNSKERCDGCGAKRQK
ncbi:MAG: hypothetical protein MJ054_01645 [Clostridia bacterium]|nr:hypothetical protein [Clostridia bacterium]